MESSLSRHVLTGVLVRPNAAVIPGSDGKPASRHKVWFSLCPWRLDSGQLNHEPIDVWNLDAESVSVYGPWADEFYQGRLVRVQAWWDDEPVAIYKKKGDWRFDRVLGLDPADDPEMPADYGLAADPPTEAWHVQQLNQRVVIAAAGPRIEELQQAIQLPSDGSWSINPRQRLGGPGVYSAVRYMHSSHGKPLEFGQRTSGLLNLYRRSGAKVDEIRLESRFDDLTVGNAAIQDFCRRAVAPAATRLGMDFELTPGMFVVPNVRRIAPTVRGGVTLSPHYLSHSQAQRGSTPAIDLVSLTTTLRCAVFGGLPIHLTVSETGLGSEHEGLGSILKSFKDMSPARADAIRSEATRGLWKFRHKNRREYDPSDAAEIASIWDEVTIERYGTVLSDGVELGIQRPTMDWPLRLKLRGGDTFQSLKRG